jgi:hypothetical protein
MAGRRAAESGTLLVLLVLGLLAVGSRRGEAQTVGRGGKPARTASGSSVPTTTRGTDPNGNSPLNPSGGRSTANRTGAFLYFPTAQTVPGRGEVPRPESPPAEGSRRMMIPGAGAADYFDREPVARPGPRRLAGPRNRHFANRGR